MPYLIDGHNLIPKLGFRLDDPDDEIKLGNILQDFARIKRQQVEVYFDGAPAGQAGPRKLGTVKAYFIRRGQTADSAIRARLNSMGKSAKNWTVISSDREVQNAARVNRASFFSSEEFVQQIKVTLREGMTSASGEPHISSQDVDEWMKIFNGGE
ncbi:MAG: NYN domain-containing protein [Anaerolineales bacterium]|nr:NYN domain-containing protein [Anaerolineales bacterium]